ncbi:MAG: PLDc N-terminal domain-containing protein [Dysgonamonadaceae bacterium]|nr:PLDc N-terminal domain-containing protein [Dysgonamonadaceae bacterium]MDD3356514.1 PLDc N-terminal domain-containing protein [Dysgonamonadaceae bacterium]MDD4605071.1 PLDc N-terminal domain-containing protein [Dysgonamonadaceae bacterium]HUI32747.1 PLDc N-terminal domain-containing protein [Dysgonamonadaceae bacterium]
MRDFIWVLLPLILAVDLVAIYHLVKRTEGSFWIKFLWVLIILLIPMIGVSSFYMWITFSQERNIGRKKTR